MEATAENKERCERELRQIMAACGRKSKKIPRISFSNPTLVCSSFHYGPNGRKHMSVVFLEGRLPRLKLHGGQGDNFSFLSSEPSWLYTDKTLASEMARIMFKLGWNPAFIAEHFEALSHHEQIELRYEMPHEFWPQKWLDEEQSASHTITKPLVSQ